MKGVYGMITNFCAKYNASKLMMIIGQQPVPEVERLYSLDDVIQANTLNSYGIGVTGLLQGIAQDAYLLGRMDGVKLERSRRKEKHP